MNNSEIFQSIQVADNMITNYCQSGLYDKTDIYHTTYQKITNLRLCLLNNAIRLFNGKESLIQDNNKETTLEQINELMLKICQIISQTNFIVEVERNIKKLIQDSSFNLNESFINNPTDEEVKLQAQEILSGI